MYFIYIGFKSIRILSTLPSSSFLKFSVTYFVYIYFYHKLNLSPNKEFNK